MNKLRICRKDLKATTFSLLWVVLIIIGCSTVARIMPNAPVIVATASIAAPVVASLIVWIIFRIIPDREK